MENTILSQVVEEEFEISADEGRKKGECRSRASGRASRTSTHRRVQTKPAASLHAATCSHVQLRSIRFDLYDQEEEEEDEDKTTNNKLNQIFRTTTTSTK